RPRSQPDVLRDRLEDADTRLGLDLDGVEEARRQDLDPLRLLSLHHETLGRLEPQDEAGRADGQPHAAEAPPLVPRQIEEAEVQPRLRPDFNPHRATPARAPRDSRTPRAPPRHPSCP